MEKSDIVQVEVQLDIADFGADIIASSGAVSAGHRKRKQVDPSSCQYISKASHFRERLSLCWHYLFSRPVARQLSSAYVCLTSVFGMGTGGPTQQSIPTI